jgi:hypothetical protein
MSLHKFNKTLKKIYGRGKNDNNNHNKNKSPDSNKVYSNNKIDNKIDNRKPNIIDYNLSLTNPPHSNTLPNNMHIQTLNNIMLMTNNFIIMKLRFENAVALDCEMVGVGEESVLGHVVIVDFNGFQLYNKYVIPRGGTNVITDYREKYSGLTPALLKNIENTDKLKNIQEHSFEVVKNEVHAILNNRIVVGHGLQNDFNVLEFNTSPENIWDSTIIHMYMKDHLYIPGLKQAKRLKVIAKEFADDNIQQENKGHSPLEDARASMNLYRLSLFYPKIIYNDMSIP